MSPLADTPAADVSEVGRGRRWGMLAASVVAQAAAAVVINGPAFLIPALQHERGLSLAEAGTLAAATIAGVMLSLFAWGVVVDRVGERRVLVVGLAATTVLSAAATLVHSLPLLVLLLLLAGAAAASTNAASGRVVVGWFPPERRGLAMGVRQMAQPLGVALAAVSMAVTADRADVSTALWIPVAATVVALVVVLLVVLDPPRPPVSTALTANPYRASGFLARIHLVSVLLVVPQFVVWTYALTWLVQARGWDPGAAGALVALTHVLGALGRLGAGHLSDVVGSRVQPLRWVGISAAASMLLLALTEPTTRGIVLLVVASAVTVADNGLAFTSVAERAGAFWSGRALGVQNTAQYLAAAAAAPLAGVAIGSVGFAWTFGLSALLPVVAVPLVPREDERAPD